MRNTKIRVFFLDEKRTQNFATSLVKENYVRKLLQKVDS